MHPTFNRRAFLRYSGCGALGAASTLAAAVPARASSEASPQPTPDEALTMLKEGNRAFVSGKQVRPAQDESRRHEIAHGQSPFAIVVTCSDSRVSPELLFDRGLGDLFIIRNAGNTIDDVAMGSIEYAVDHLKSPLLVILGHERCGAVTAAIEVVKNNADLPGSLGEMVEPILPAVLKAQSESDSDDLLDKAVRENVRRTVTHLRTSSEPMMMQPQQAGTLKVVGACYDLDDGTVDFFMES